jgi:hypothetical protein
MLSWSICVVWTKLQFGKQSGFLIPECSEEASEMKGSEENYIMGNFTI